MTRLWPEGEAVRIWTREKSPIGAPTGAPLGFVWCGKSHRILEVCNRWRVHTYWWEPDQTVWREYLKVTTDTGLLCLIYRDLLSGGWFLARIYD